MTNCVPMLLTSRSFVTIISLQAAVDWVFTKRKARGWAAAQYPGDCHPMTAGRYCQDDLRWPPTKTSRKCCRSWQTKGSKEIAKTSASRVLSRMNRLKANRSRKRSVIQPHRELNTVRPESWDKTFYKTRNYRLSLRWQTNYLRLSLWQARMFTTLVTIAAKSMKRR